MIMKTSLKVRMMCDQFPVSKKILITKGRSLALVGQSMIVSLYSESHYLFLIKIDIYRSLQNKTSQVLHVRRPGIYARIIHFEKKKTFNPESYSIIGTFCIQIGRKLINSEYLKTSGKSTKQNPSDRLIFSYQQRDFFPRECQVVKYSFISYVWRTSDVFYYERICKRPAVGIRIQKTKKKHWKIQSFQSFYVRSVVLSW